MDNLVPIILAMLGSSVIGGIISKWMDKNKTKAEIRSLNISAEISSSEEWKKLYDTVKSENNSMRREFEDKVKQITEYYEKRTKELTEMITELTREKKSIADESEKRGKRIDALEKQVGELEREVVKYKEVSSVLSKVKPEIHAMIDNAAAKIEDVVHPPNKDPI